MRRFGLLVLAGLLLSSVHAQTLDRMRFSVQALSPVLSVSQTLETRLRITNRSGTPMYVYKDLGYYIGAWAYASSGESMAKQFLEDVRPPPPDRSSFILLKPGQYIEHIRTDNLAELGIRKAGQYRIEFNYSSGIPPASTHGLPVWMGTQRASVDIRVVNRIQGH